VTVPQMVGREINEVCVADVETRHLRPCFHFTDEGDIRDPVLRIEIGVRRQTHDKYRNRTRQLRAEKSVGLLNGPIVRDPASFSRGEIKRIKREQDNNRHVTFNFL